MSNVAVQCPGAGRRWVRFLGTGNAACSVCGVIYYGLVEYQPKVNSPHHIVPAHIGTRKVLS